MSNNIMKENNRNQITEKSLDKFEQIEIKINEDNNEKN